jgi:hypothetical protein
MQPGALPASHGLCDGCRAQFDPPPKTAKDRRIARVRERRRGRLGPIREVTIGPATPADRGPVVDVVLEPKPDGDQ